MNENNPPKADRLVASYLAQYSTEVVGHAVHKYDISIEDMAIFILVYSESTRPLREDTYLGAKFGFDERALPNEYRVSVKLKFIHTSLGLSRETTRRKLERLVARGILARINGGYVFQQPHDEHEFSRDFRQALTKRIEGIIAHANGPSTAD